MSDGTPLNDKRFFIDQDDKGNWFVFDKKDCCCIAGPMGEYEASRISDNNNASAP